MREKLGLDRGEEVYAIHRLDTVNEQLCVLLDQHYDLQMRSVEEHLSASAAKPDEACTLKVAKGQPLLVLEDTVSL